MTSYLTRDETSNVRKNTYDHLWSGKKLLSYIVRQVKVSQPLPNDFEGHVMKCPHK